MPRSGRFGKWQKAVHKSEKATRYGWLFDTANFLSLWRKGGDLHSRDTKDVHWISSPIRLYVNTARLKAEPIKSMTCDVHQAQQIRQSAAKWQKIPHGSDRPIAARAPTHLTPT